MPARLADGLGPESDPGEGSLRRLPHPRFTEELVPPRRLTGRQADLGCYKPKLDPEDGNVKSTVRGGAGG